MSQLVENLAARLEQLKHCGQIDEKPRLHVAYGTAGFRGKADQIQHLYQKVGLISAVRCLHLRASVGIMVTASHNPIQDNGLKIVDSNGEMLVHNWEPIVEKFCNLNCISEIIDYLNKLIQSFDIDLKQVNEKLHVFIGQDTRPSSEALVKLARRGIELLSKEIIIIDLGQVTTPVLHYVVAESNKISNDGDKIIATPSHYYDQLASGVVEIFDQLDLRRCSANVDGSDESYKANELVVDCANGVGVETMRKLIKHGEFSKHLPVALINTGNGILNHLCGADYVKTARLAPSLAADTRKRYASLDGDADRVVYFYLSNNFPVTNNLKLNLLDGDKIMVLYAIYLKDLLEKSNLKQQLSLGCVQTAYANGASTNFITNRLNLPVDCVDTGVKNLHKQALNYDFGIYFEANGHGTIWISDKARTFIETSADQQNFYVQDLKRLFKIINNYTGDAISDVLVVESILKHFNWNIEKWNSLYDDMANALIKVEIKDRTCIKTSNAGRTCTQPESLQQAIDSIVTNYEQSSRCFVRPSGTENVVRIYSEAASQKSAEELAAAVKEKVIELCN